MYCIPPSVRAVLFDAVGTLIYPNPSVAEAYYQAGRQFGSALSQDEIASRFRAAFAQPELLDKQLAHGRTDEAAERRRWQAIVADVFDDVHDAAGLFDRLWLHFAQPRHWSLFDDVVPAWQALTGQRSAGGSPAQTGEPPVLRVSGQFPCTPDAQASESGAMHSLARRACIATGSGQPPEGGTTNRLTLGVASNFDSRLQTICDALPPLANCPQRFISSQIGFRKPATAFFRALEQQLGLQPAQILLVGDDLDNDYRGARQAGWHAVLLTRRGSAGVPDVPCIRALTDLAP